jgi:polyhydroxybutyrate depolymerase
MIRYILILFIGLAWGQPENHQFSHDGLDRDYYIYIPDSITIDAPLLFILHGYGSDANAIMNSSQFNPIADEHGFIVCYPQGTEDNWSNRQWFSGWYSNDPVDDVGFLMSLAQHIQTEFSIGTDKTFCTGMSNGADMSYRLACEASSVFKAVAPVAGCMFEWAINACSPDNPIPVFEIHGTNDNMTLWGGDAFYYYGAYVGVETTFEFWSQMNVTTESIIDTLPNLNTQDGSYVISHKNINGINNNEVWLYEVVNGGHHWPGAYGNMDVSASDEIWGFFNNIISQNLDISVNNMDQFLNSFNIYSNYPNPFNPITTLRYVLPEDVLVNITIYDMMGRQVKTLVNSPQTAGYKSTQWERYQQ